MAAIIQLACKGIQDNYLTFNPEITNFRSIYKRHTQFAIQTIKNTFTTEPNFGSKYSSIIGRCGDLLSKMYLVLVLPALHVLDNDNYKIAWVKKIAFKLVKSIELEIGSILVEKHYGEWYNIWYELSTPLNARYDSLIGLDKELNKPSKYIPSTELAIPLQFWFNKSMSLALPLLSLPNQEIKINIELSEASQCIIQSPTNFIKTKNSLVTFERGDVILQNKYDCITCIAKFQYEDIEKNRIYYKKIFGEFSEGKITKLNDNNTYAIATQKECIIDNLSFYNNLKLCDTYLLCDYVLLSSDEREKILIKNLDRNYVIEQVLYCDEKVLTGPNQVNTIKFSNLCKELIWITQLNEAVINKQYFNYTKNIYKNMINGYDNSIIKKETVLVDNIERVTYRNSKYFTQIQPYCGHTSTQDGIHVYSFSLFPEELQPSGSINLENISNLGLKIKISKNKKYNDIKLRTYAVIYNVFRVENNLGALLFNNNNI